MFEFKSFWYLTLLIPVISLFWFERRQLKKQQIFIPFSSFKYLQKLKPSWTVKTQKLLKYFEYLCFFLIIIALCRPQTGEDTQQQESEGIDIMLALDISGSMRTLDFKPKNRLHVAKNVIQKFIEQRPFDRIGLTIFAGKSFTQCPLTLDHRILISFLQKVDFGLIEDGTAIGTALLNAGNRLKDSKGKSKITILLTDGESNRGDVSPEIASKALAALNIKVYTIGVGKEGMQPIEVNGFFGKQIIHQPSTLDEKSLKEIANITRGKFFRAQNPEELKNIYKEINTLEKTEFDEQIYTYYSEDFQILLWITLTIMLVNLILSNTKLRKIP